MDLTKLFKIIEEEGKIQLSDSFKTTVENTFKAAVAEKEVALTEAKSREDALTAQNTELTAKIEEMKTTSLDEVKKEVEVFKEGLVEKISSFMEIELEKMIPQDIAEKVAKAEIYEPIVEGFKATIARYGIVLESEGMTLLKEAKEEIEKLRSDVDEITKSNLEMKNESEKTAAVMTLHEKMNGLTEDQQKKIVTIFKGKSAEEISESLLRPIHQHDSGR